MRLSLMVALWALLVAGGVGALVCYDQRPCEAARAPATWPAGTRLQRSSRLPTLLMFVHPECPCSRASLAELARLRARSSAVEIQLVVAEPQGLKAKRPEEKKGVKVILDEGLLESNRFGAFSSGQVLLYGIDGRLRYAGGLTGSRGHQGPSDGFDAVVRALEGGSGGLETAPVFGCELGTREYCGGLHEPTSRP